MATEKSFTEFVCDQLRGTDASYRKMFGEYMVYISGKPVFLLCDNNVYVKINEVTTEILGEQAETGYPYEGAKLRYIVTDVDNAELMFKLAVELEKITPFPKKRK